MISQQFYNIDGLNTSFIQKNDFNTIQCMICFNYGSKDRNAIINNNKVIFPAGIAHFLEHKMFEDKSENMFQVFNKLGVDVNAYTNFTSTTYYFECNQNFELALKNLCRLVSNPYFTDENVQREKGIISQEINMYKDNPYWRVYFNLLNIMYQKNNTLTDDIAGKIKDIQEINKEMLYSCYDSFYTKDNALLIIVGDLEKYVDIPSISQIIKQNLNLSTNSNATISSYLPFQIDKKIKSKSITTKMKINQKIFNIGFKYTGVCDKIDLAIISNRILLEIMFGKSSEFYNNLYQQNIINNSFSFSYNIYNQELSDLTSFCIFTGVEDENTSNISKLKSAIITEIQKYNNLINNNLINNNFNSEFKINFKNNFNNDFIRIQKKFIGEFISGFNNISNITCSEADFFSKGFTTNDYYNTINSITSDNILNCISYLSQELYTSIIE